MPENHACSQIDIAKVPKEEAPTAPRYEYKTSYPPGRPMTRFWFSRTELRHLTLGAVLVMGVGLSIMFSSLGLRLFELPTVLVAGVLVFVGLFLCHEIAHKLVAQRYELWAEFRLTLPGVLITLVSMVPFILKIVSPGAVTISGHSDKRSIGKTAIAGPLVNIVLATVSLAFVFALDPFDPFFVVAVFSAVVNSYVAVFNLLPVAILDGLKVFQWNKLVWVGVFAVSIALLFIISALNL